MCISAEVSFGLSGLLLATGLYCVTRAFRTDKRLIPLALVPLIFCVQQFCEGWVWTGVHHSDPQLLKTAALCYLFFALFLWPVWASLSIVPMESRRGVRAFLGVMALAGAIVGGCLYLPVLLHPQWLSVEVVNHSIYYNTSAVEFLGFIPSLAWGVIYLGAVAVPFFVSRHRRLFHMGLALVLSAAASHVFFRYAAASIWCFFAAGLSVYLCSLFYRAPAGRAVAGAVAG